jgi:hypothetical protein
MGDEGGRVVLKGERLRRINCNCTEDFQSDGGSDEVDDSSELGSCYAYLEIQNCRS